MSVNASKTELAVMVWAKAIIAGLLAGTVMYSIIAQVPVDERLIELIVLLLAGYFGFSAKLYRDGARRE